MSTRTQLLCHASWLLPMSYPRLQGCLMSPDLPKYFSLSCVKAQFFLKANFLKLSTPPSISAPQLLSTIAHPPIPTLSTAPKLIAMSLIPPFVEVAHTLPLQPPSPLLLSSPPPLSITPPPPTPLLLSSTLPPLCLHQQTLIFRVKINAMAKGVSEIC